jgi:ribonuclease P protein subunit RPR2
MRKQVSREIARERIEILIANALREINEDDHLANCHSRLAKRIAMRTRLRLPYEIRQLYCKRCKQFISPGKSARIRIGRSNIKAIRITCLKCGHVYRKVLNIKKNCLSSLQVASSRE